MIQLPPVVLYAFGAFLLLVGVLRAYILGWSRRDEQQEAEAEVAAEAEAGVSRRARRAVYSPQKHMRWGLIWVALGLFIIVSTLTRSR